MEMRAHTAASTRSPPGRKRADQHPGTTNKASPEGKYQNATGEAGERYRKHWERQQRYATAKTRWEMPGMLRETLGNTSNATLLPRHARKRREC